MDVYGAIAEPHRRELLELLRREERTVSELCARMALSQPGVSKHLKVLREAGLVEVRADGRRRVYALQPHPLLEVAGWLVPFRA